MASGLAEAGRLHWNLTEPALIQAAVARGEGQIGQGGEPAVGRAVDENRHNRGSGLRRKNRQPGRGAGRAPEKINKNTGMQSDKKRKCFSFTNLSKAALILPVEY